MEGLAALGAVDVLTDEAVVDLCFLTAMRAIDIRGSHGLVLEVFRSSSGWVALAKPVAHPLRPCSPVCHWLCQCHPPVFDHLADESLEVGFLVGIAFETGGGHG